MASLILALALAQGERDPFDILSEYASGLRKALRPNVQREELRRAAEVAFNKDILRAKVAKPRPIWEHYNEYLTQLDEGRRSFTGPDQRPERSLWIAGCRTALLKMATQCKIPETAPSTAELYEASLDAVMRARAKHTGDHSNDLRIAAYESVNLLFHAQLRRCRPPKGDPKAVYTKQVTELGLRLGKDNELPERMLRDMAKACLDRDVTALR